MYHLGETGLGRGENQTGLHFNLLCMSRSYQRKFGGWMIQWASSLLRLD